MKVAAQVWLGFVTVLFGSYATAVVLGGNEILGGAILLINAVAVGIGTDERFKG